MRFRIFFLAVIFLTACDQDADKSQLIAENLLRHSFSYLEKGNIGAAWKSYLESVYLYNDLGKELPAQGYVLASTLCIMALKKENVKIPCRKFRFGDAEPVTINNRDQTIDVSISYLDRVKVSDDFNNTSIQKLGDCYRTSVLDQAVDCASLGMELLRPYFQISGKSTFE